MTTTFTVKVNGKSRATVLYGTNPAVEVEGNYNGGRGEKTFVLPHQMSAQFSIVEQAVLDGDEREPDPSELPPAEPPLVLDDPEE